MKISRSEFLKILIAIPFIGFANSCGIGLRSTMSVRNPPIIFHRFEKPGKSGLVEGDLWIDCNSNNTLYRYNGNKWRIITGMETNGELSPEWKQMAKLLKNDPHIHASQRKD